MTKLDLDNHLERMKLFEKMTGVEADYFLLQIIRFLQGTGPIDNWVVLLNQDSKKIIGS